MLATFARTTVKFDLKIEDEFYWLSERRREMSDSDFLVLS